MSILHGAIHPSVIKKDDMPYGSLLSEAAFFPFKGCYDVKVDQHAKHAFAAFKNGLAIFDLKDPAAPTLISRLDGLGGSRQIALDETCAYITARSDGLYIVDIRNLTEPCLTSVFDTVELATGIDVWGNLCLVASRHLGVEIIDVADPQNPRYLSSVLAGEAQSVFIDGTLMYVGDWVNRTVHIFDVSNPRRPSRVTAFILDGFADGIFVQSGICYAATGHHNAKLKNRRKYVNYTYITPEMMEDGYGRGHGLEIFDVSDPAAPEYISSVKFPPLYVSPNDTWRVTVSGDYAYVTDTYNGMFIIDITDLSTPRFEAYFKLDYIEKGLAGFGPAIQRLTHPITGAACATGFVYAAGCTTGMHVLQFDRCMPVPPQSKPSFAIPPEEKRRDSFYSSEGQVHAVTFCGNTLVAACGNKGLAALDEDGAELHLLETEGIAHDVQYADHKLFAAEGMRGVAVYDYSDADGFRYGSRLLFDEGKTCARQVVVAPKPHLLAVQLQSGLVAFVRYDNNNLSLVNTVKAGGMLYHRHLCRDVLCARYVGALPLSKGLVLYNVSGKEPGPADIVSGLESCPIEDGAAFTNDSIILINRRKYAVVRNPADIQDPRAIKMRSVPGARLNGQPFSCGRTLVLVNRCLGTAEFIDITDTENPVYVRTEQLPGHPECAAENGGYIWISCGHGGLYRFGT